MHLDSKFLFIHNPRTSGTSFRRALLRGYDPNARLQWPATRFDLGKHSTPAQVKQAFAESSFTPEDAWDRVEKVTIVRHPADRLVSLYHLWRRPLDDSAKMSVERAKFPPKVDKVIRQLRHRSLEATMQKQNRIAFLKWALELPFNRWLKFSVEYQWQGCPYLRDLGPMTTIPQCRWADGMDTILRFEDRDQIDAWLTGHSFEPAALENQTDREPWAGYYDQESRDFVEKHFAEDFERFGY